MWFTSSQRCAYWKSELSNAWTKHIFGKILHEMMVRLLEIKRKYCRPLDSRTVLQGVCDNGFMQKWHVMQTLSFGVNKKVSFFFFFTRESICCMSALKKKNYEQNAGAHTHTGTKKNLTKMARSWYWTCSSAWTDISLTIKLANKSG